MSGTDGRAGTHDVPVDDGDVGDYLVAICPGAIGVRDSILTPTKTGLALYYGSDTDIASAFGATVLT